jgi:hypothetical protein
MRHFHPAFVLSVSTICGACSGSSTPVAPSPTTTASLTGDVTIGFNGLSGLPCSGLPQVPTSSSCVVQSYTESGVTVTVSATSGEWSVRTDYGHAAPFIEFSVPCVQQAGTCTTPATPGIGTIQVTAKGATFSFKSVDLYASLVPIPYQITGLRKSTTVFTLTNTLPNTRGDFATVMNPQASAVIDTLLISLTDAVNAMGLDNIAVVGSGS